MAGNTQDDEMKKMLADFEADRESEIYELDMLGVDEQWDWELL